MPFTGTHRPSLSPRLAPVMIAVVCFGIAFVSVPLHAQTFTVLHFFNKGTGSLGGGELAEGPGGAVFGTTPAGGTGTACFQSRQLGCGTIFRWKSGQYKPLYSFLGYPDGAFPQGGVVRDLAGNLYGVTTGGGPYDPHIGFGTVFKLDSTGKETILYPFTGGTDGSAPYAGLVLDQAGNLYGTTLGGGAFQKGTIFKLDTAGHETPLHSFTGGADGNEPYGRLLLDESGNLYGTTVNGGDLSCEVGLGCGVIFKIDPSGNYTVLHAFGGTDGSNPYFGLVRDAHGNLYGTAQAGGAGGAGVIFKIDSANNYSVLYNFLDDSYGGYPGEVVTDPQGNLYGVTTLSASSFGTVYKLSATGGIVLLHPFSKADGEQPQNLLLDKTGVIYGTTSRGGQGGCPEGCGVLYSIAR